MIETTFRFAGGIGLFLLGMSLLTEGLKDFAGTWLREQLIRFTGTPGRAFFSGVVATLLVQSSSATTVAVVGFVSAGLLTFPQALGVLFGASLGTTATGWIVATIGLKLKLGLYVLPLLVVGVFLRLLGSGRQVFLGDALAGFALIFVGIEFMQTAMQSLALHVDLTVLREAGWVGDVLAVGVGILLTILMQSSSAAVATALTAVNTGTLSFEQAASVVIGAAIGTTVTGVLAALRANVPARRTAWAHVIFNLVTGLVALVLLPIHLRLIAIIQDQWEWSDPATGLAIFHSVFISVGVLIFLPLVQQFAAFIEWLVPDLGPTWTRHLDAAVRRVPSVAISATARALSQTARETLRDLSRGLVQHKWSETPDESTATVREIQDYLEKLPVAAEDSAMIQERLEQLHAIDHLYRLISRLRPPFTLQRVLAGPKTVEPVRDCRRVLDLAEQVMIGAASEAERLELQRLADQLKKYREERRILVIQDSALGKLRPAEALQLLDAYRWVDRVAAHAARVAEYLRPS
jgi:phosphate:Na+ symporter